MSQVKIVALTPVCQEDADRWWAHYKQYMESVQLPFVLHFCHCQPDFIATASQHPLCLKFSRNDDPQKPFEDNHRQMAYDVLKGHADCMLLQDIDETWEPGFVSALQEQMQDTSWDNGRIRWVNLWGDAETVRLNNPSNPNRVKIIRLDKDLTWRWKGTVVDPYAFGRDLVTRYTDLICLHWGLMTEELRQLHKIRWDRSFTRLLGRNPHGIWDYMLDPQYPARTMPLEQFLRERPELTPGELL